MWWVGIYKSTDYGNTWLPCYSENVNTIYVSSENNIYAGGYQGNFIKSTDAGATWSSNCVTSHTIVSITSTSNGQIFFTTEYGPIFTSTDFGETMIEITGLSWTTSIDAEYKRLFIFIY